MKNKISIYLPLFFALVLIAGIFLGYKLSPFKTGPGILQMNMNKYNKLDDVINYVEKEYVDSVSRKDLVKGGIQGILDNLDPHSQYILATEFHEVNDPLTGNFEGIGIQFRIENDSIVVVHTLPGGPSEKVGLMAGDRIVNVNDTLIAGVGITDEGAMRKLKGERGTVVDVEVFRRGFPDLLDFEITRDVIPTYSIDMSYMPEPGIGYIRLSRFSATTSEEFEKAIDTLNAQGMNSLILDLRDNSGGYLQAAIDLADEFLEKGKLIVFTQGLHEPRESFYATNKGKLIHTRLIILINGGTASASEILAGAIQDNDRGTIVGRRSFGKGLVQRQLDFLDGSALRLTVARYYTPTGRCIQKPYKKGNGFEEYYSESYHRRLNGELEDADSIHFNDSLKYTTPGGKVVYGGGGIMPDVFVPVDNDKRLVYYNKLIQKGLIFRFAFDYTDKHRKELQRYSNADDFIQNFHVSKQMLNEFIDYAGKKGLKGETEEIEFTSTRIKTMLKAYIGRNLFDNDGFFPVYLSIDDIYKKAIDLLQSRDSI